MRTVRREILKFAWNHQRWIRKYWSYSGSTPAEDPKEKMEKPPQATIIYRHIDQVNPAFDLVPNNPDPYLCITLPQTCKILKKAKKNKNGVLDIESEERMVTVVALSDGQTRREVYVVNKENFRKLGIRTYTKPLLPEQRWSLESFKQWLTGHPNSFPDMMDVYRAVRRPFEFYMDYPDRRAYSFKPLWVMGTYFFQLFETARSAD